MKDIIVGICIGIGIVIVSLIPISLYGGFKYMSLLKELKDSRFMVIPGECKMEFTKNNIFASSNPEIEALVVTVSCPKQK